MAKNTTEHKTVKFILNGKPIGTYVGEYINNVRQGFGTMIYINCGRFTGDWFNDYENTGTYYYEDGTYYTGNWFAGKRNGRGTQYYKPDNGQQAMIQYEGDWSDDVYNGRGILYDESMNPLHQGLFLAGKYIRPIDIVTQTEHIIQHTDSSYDESMINGQIGSNMQYTDNSNSYDEQTSSNEFFIDDSNLDDELTINEQTMHTTYFIENSGSNDELTIKEQREHYQQLIIEPPVQRGECIRIVISYITKGGDNGDVLMNSDRYDIYNRNKYDKYNQSKVNNYQQVKSYNQVDQLIQHVKDMQIDNAIYNGFVLNNLPHGYGHMQYNNQSIYEGFWYNGQREGFGHFNQKKVDTSLVNDGSIQYWGTWQNDMPNGSGYYQNDNSTYSGSVINGQYNGFGIQCVYQNGKKLYQYEGNWKDNTMHGFGQLQQCNEHIVYIGQFHHNMKPKVVKHDDIGSM